MSYRFRKAILKFFNPRAFDSPLLKELDDHEMNMGKRRAADRKQRERRMMPVYAVVHLALTAICLAISMWLPGVFSTLDKLSMAVMVNTMWLMIWKTLNRW